ncbi:MAG: GHKL domain-containing protein, partial [Oscillospiraceae bacterium]
GIMLISIALPYFILILSLTQGPVAQRIFNFWLWINIYLAISTINSVYKYFVPGHYFLDIFVVIILYGGYYFLYDHFLKEKHHKMMRELKINWWIVSIIPVLFTFVFRVVYMKFGPLSQNPQNFPKAIILNLLMISVYALVFYTFYVASETAAKKQAAMDLEMQLELHRRHYEEMMNTKQAEMIFRHDARHRDMLLLSLAENKEIEKIKRLLQKDISAIGEMTEKVYTENMMINAVLTEYIHNAEKKGLQVKHDIKLMKVTQEDETELCVMLSNLLENAVRGGNTFLEIIIKQVKNQLCINIKNDYTQKTMRDENGDYISTKASGGGYGLKSSRAMLEKNGGFLQIENDGKVFNVFASMKN